MYSHVHSHSSQTDPLYSPSSPDLSSGAASSSGGSLLGGGGKGPSRRTAQVSGAAQVSGGVAAVTSQQPPGKRGPGRSALPVPCPTGVPGGGKRTRRPSGGQRKRAPRQLRGRAGLRGGWSVSTRGLSRLRGAPSPRPSSLHCLPPPTSAPLSRPSPIFREPFPSHHFHLASMVSLTSRTFHLRAPAFVGSPPHARELAVRPLPAEAPALGAEFLAARRLDFTSSLQCVSFQALARGPHASHRAAGLAQDPPCSVTSRPPAPRHPPCLSSPSGLSDQDGSWSRGPP